MRRLGLGAEFEGGFGGRFSFSEKNLLLLLEVGNEALEDTQGPGDGRRASNVDRMLTKNLKLLGLLAEYIPNRFLDPEFDLDLQCIKVRNAVLNESLHLLDSSIKIRNVTFYLCDGSECLGTGRVG